MIVRAIQTDVLSSGQSLKVFIRRWVPTLRERSVLVVASKIVALSQGRVCSQADDKDALVHQEAERVIPVAPGLALTYKDGHWCPNAGIDASNAFGKYILWPEDSMAVASEIQSWIRDAYAVKEVGVIIADSRVFPGRQGVTAMALGYAGFRGLRDYRGQMDLAGRALEYTTVNVADALATAASLLMGEGNECRPLAIIEEASAEFLEKPVDEEMAIDREEDLFGALWRS